MTRFDMTRWSRATRALANLGETRSALETLCRHYPFFSAGPGTTPWLPNGTQAIPAVSNFLEHAHTNAPLVMHRICKRPLERIRESTQTATQLRYEIQKNVTCAQSRERQLITRRMAG